MAGVIKGPGDLQPTFAALVEEAFFVQLGVASPPLADYVTRVLVESLKPLEPFTADRLATRHIAQVAEDAAHQQPDGVEPLGHRRGVLQRAGEFTLFWVGMYPEIVGQLNARAADPVADFREHGQRFFLEAAELADDDADPAPSVLAFISHDFILCESGLQAVRRGLDALRQAG